MGQRSFNVRVAHTGRDIVDISSRYFTGRKRELEGGGRVDIHKFVGEFFSSERRRSPVGDLVGKFEIAYVFFTRPARHRIAGIGALSADSGRRAVIRRRSVEIERSSLRVLFALFSFLSCTGEYCFPKLPTSSESYLRPFLVPRFLSSFLSIRVRVRSRRRLTYRFREGRCSLWPSPPCLRGPKVLASSVPPFFIPRGRPPSSLTLLPFPRRARSLCLKIDGSSALGRAREDPRRRKSACETST